MNVSCTYKESLKYVFWNVHVLESVEFSVPVLTQTPDAALGPCASVDLLHVVKKYLGQVRPGPDAGVKSINYVDDQRPSDVMLYAVQIRAGLARGLFY